MSPYKLRWKNRPEVNLLRRLEHFKDKMKKSEGWSWDEACNRLGLHKKTVMRWRKTGKISKSYQELLDIKLRDWRV